MSKAKDFLESLDEDTKKDKKYSRIEMHGNNLNKIFNLDMDPVELSKKLLRLENKMRRAVVDDTNRDISPEEFSKMEKSTLAAVDAILGFKAKKIPVFVDDEPRGYALKIDSDWIHKNKATIFTDMGGFGVLAPDFND